MVFNAWKILLAKGIDTYQPCRVLFNSWKS